MLYNIFYLLHGILKICYFATNNLKQIIMTKQSFPIPEGCKTVTVEQLGNQIITTFEPGFKRGDVLVSKKNLCFIFRPTKTDKAYYYFMHDIDRTIGDSFFRKSILWFIV